METKRTFIAVQIADSIHEKMREIRQNLPELSNYAKLVNPEIAHITLKFLGETTDQQIQQISDALDESLTGGGAFEFSCCGTGVFPNKRRPSVLWLGVEDSQNKLAGLNAAAENVVSMFGFAPESRKFSPHITLGRVKKKHLRFYPQLAEFLNYPEFKLNNPVQQVIFYESRLNITGPVYSVLKTIKL